MRHTHSIYLINGKTGAIMWTLGGIRNTFTELPPTNPGPDPIAPVLTMNWQHHARLVPGTHGRELTFFDNHGIETSQGRCRSSGTCSRGLRIALDTTVSPPTVQIQHQYLHPADLRSKNQGSMQLLPGGASDHVFIGWGHSPAFTEHDAATGEVVMDVQFAPWPDNETPAPDNYRAYKMDWTATPWWDPAIAVREDLHGDLDVFASWNGATEVREWVARGGEGEGVVLARSRRTGFETRLSVGSRAWVGKVWVEALDGNGTVLRASRVLNLSSKDVTILQEIDEIELLYPTTGEKAFASRGPWVILGAGLVGLLVGIAYCVVSRRGEKYTYLDDDDMTEVDSEICTQDVYLELDGLRNKMVWSPRGWDTPTMPRSPGREAMPRSGYQYPRSPFLDVPFPR